MKRRFFLSIWLLLAFTLQSIAQGKITGKVVSANDGQPLPGVTVAVMGSSKGTITNVDGVFSIEAKKGETLVFSSVGYDSYKEQLTGQSVVNVSLKESNQKIDELVVVGYGVQKKSVVTAAISRVSAEQLNTAKPSRVEDVLKGKISGVQITQSSGQPGADSKVRIRGIGTINNSEPLYIVDGMSVDGGINYLNPVDIQSVEVLKDAASSAIYGARAANGVILVTTKSGQKGKSTINYDFSYGWQNPWKKKSVLNATEYMTIMNEALINDGDAPRYTQEQIKAAGTGTDWQKETFNYDAPIQNHQVSVAGGTEKGTYYLSFGYFDQDGIVGGNYDKSNYTRYSIRVNGTYNLFEDNSRSFLNKVRAGTTIGYSRSKSTGIETNSEYGSVLGSALTFSPLVPVYADDATAASILAVYPNAVKDKSGRVFSTPPAGFQEIANPVAMLNQPSGSLNNDDKFVTNFWGEIDIFDGLKFKSSFGADLAFWGYDSYTFPYFLATQGKKQDFSTVQSEMNRGYKWQIENVLSYNKTFGDHSITVVLGQSAQKYTYKNLGGNFRDLLENDPSKAVLNYAIADQKLSRVWGGTGGYDNTSLASYFGRLDYNYKERYIIQGTLRRDGSSNFGPNNKWAIFPAFSLGWNVTNEEFMKNRPTWFSQLKLRAGWGKNGNEKIGGFLYTSLMSGGQNYYFGGSYLLGTKDKIGENAGQMQYGSSPARIANPDIKWEESEQIDLGFDARFFNSRLSLGFDYFKKKTNGMLMYLPIPDYVGMSAPMGNVGDMENWGLEFEIGFKEKFGDVNISATGNASYLKNKLVKLGNASGETIYENAGASGVGSYVKAKNGDVFPYFYGFKVDGIAQNKAQADAYNAKYGQSAQAGDVMFRDLNNDGKITDDDKTKIGKGMPDWTYGLTLNADWKGLDVSLFFQGTIGNDIFDFSQRGDIPAMNRPSWILDRWIGEGTSNSLPRMTNKNPNSNWRSSELYIKDGSFLRLRTAQLGYTIPFQLSKKASIQRLRVFVSAENLITLTGYNGFDPEVASGGYTTIGIDRGIYPQSRTISVGANISF